MNKNQILLRKKLIKNINTRINIKTTVICCIVKDEELYINEWLLYNIIEGYITTSLKVDTPTIKFDIIFPFTLPISALIPVPSFDFLKFIISFTR